MALEDRGPALRPRRNLGVDKPEWPTLGLIVLTYALWLGVTALAGLTESVVLQIAAVVGIALATAMHSSLSHEITHGHPLPSRAWSEALVFPALSLAIPYERFRDTHLAHHRDERLTDPHEDPESNYLDPAVWAGLPRPVKWLMLFNNRLVGRMLIGPALGLVRFYADDLTAWRVPAVRRAWALHALGLIPVVGWLMLLGTPAWVVLVGSYAGLSLLRIRTFLEHRAHERAPGRSVIIEDRGPLAVLFLNNNLHALHHAQPRVAWYRLPALYRVRREALLRDNGGYSYPSYWAVFAAHLWQAKDPVPHPLMPTLMPAGSARGPDAGHAGPVRRRSTPAPAPRQASVNAQAPAGEA
ncbi:MAG: fatty acid desaturase [Pseudomonadota bacterium]